jgi:predicted enzyme related to lactoylglutathione lyase
MAKNDGGGTESTGPGVGERLARHGGLSYLEIPTIDVNRSAVFYEKVVGWKLDWRAPDDCRFEDSTGHLIGRWVIGRSIAREAGLLPYLYVDRIDDAVNQVSALGGEVALAPYAEGDLWVATIRDPAGNLIGLWQAGPR